MTDKVPLMVQLWRGLDSAMTLLECEAKSCECKTAERVGRLKTLLADNPLNTLYGQPRGSGDYYVMHNGAAWFVKDSEFFRSQGGLTEEWGKAWNRITADGIEHARLLAAVLAAQDIEPTNFYLYDTPPNPVLKPKEKWRY